MVVLDGFLLQLSTFIRVDLEVIIFAPIFLAVFLEADQEMIQQCGVPERPLSVGAKLGVHLQQSEVDS